MKINGDANQESDMAVPEIAVDSSSEIPRVDGDKRRWVWLMFPLMHDGTCVSRVFR